MKKNTINKPNPGSKEAEEQGCTCPVIDNHYGKGLPDGNFWYTMGCPIHDEEFINSVDMVVNK